MTLGESFEIQGWIALARQEGASLLFRPTQSLVGLALALAIAANSSLYGDVVIYSGADPGVGPGGVRPNSVATALTFAAAAQAGVPFGFVNTVDFENISLSTPGAPITNQEIVLGGMYLTLTGTSLSSGNGAIYGISNTPNDVLTGFNTTSGGSQHLKIAPMVNVGTATAEFNFPKPINAMGMYLTGLGNTTGNLSVTFDDGSPMSYPVTGSPNGGVQYFGFTDANKAFHSVVLKITNVTGLNRDVFGIDDIRYAVVPEPSSLFLFCLGLVLPTYMVFLSQARARATASV